ncbi:transcriptional regulator, TetR family [Burkholderia sp. GAS332]|nr:transcriptional regulator, TetR family [Burkholderia sp. GAS332]
MKGTIGKETAPARGIGAREIAARRQQSIIDATMRCIARYSYSETTVDRICAEANIARGLIHYHFGSKDALMARTYQRLAADLLNASREAAAKATSTEEKLAAIIKACFAAPVFKPSTVKVWLGFWSVAQSDPVIGNAHKALYSAHRDTLKKLFDQIVQVCGTPIDGELAAATLTAVIDGFWLERARDPSSFKSVNALCGCMQVMNAFLLRKPCARNI